MQEKPRSDSIQKMQEKKVVKGLIGFWSETTSNSKNKNQEKTNELHEPKNPSEPKSDVKRKKSKSVSHAPQNNSLETTEPTTTSKNETAPDSILPEARQSLKRSISELKIKLDGGFQIPSSLKRSGRFDSDVQAANKTNPTPSAVDTEKPKETEVTEIDKDTNQRPLSTAPDDKTVNSSCEEKRDTAPKDVQSTTAPPSVQKDNHSKKKTTKTHKKSPKSPKIKSSSPSSKLTSVSDTTPSTTSDAVEDKNDRNQTEAKPKHTKTTKKRSPHSKSKTSLKSEPHKVSKLPPTESTADKTVPPSANSTPENEKERIVFRNRNAPTSNIQEQRVPLSEDSVRVESETLPANETEAVTPLKKTKSKGQHRLLEKAKKIKKAIWAGILQEHKPSPSNAPEKLSESRRNTVDLSSPSQKENSRQILQRSLSDNERILQKQKENISKHKKQKTESKTRQTPQEGQSQQQPQTEPQQEQRAQQSSPHQTQIDQQKQPTQKQERHVLVRSHHKRKAKSAPRILTRKTKSKPKNEETTASGDRATVPDLKLDKPSGNLSPRKYSPRKQSPRKFKALRSETDFSSKMKKNLAEIFKTREEVGMRYQKEVVEFEESEDSEDKEDINIWDEPQDSNANIRFDSKNDIYILSPGRPTVLTRQGGRGLEIQCATLNKLVERLTYPDYNADDKIYMKIFLATYEDFTSPQRLLKKLVQRFRVPKDKMSSEAMQQIQSRVCSVIKYWIDNYPSKMTRAMIERFRKFVNEELKDPQHEPLREILTNSLETKIEKDLAAKARIKISDENPLSGRPTLSTAVSAPNMRSLNMIDALEAISDIDIARQITFVDYQIYNCIKPWEILKQVWRSQDTKYNVYNSGIRELTARFNCITNWVLSSILSQEKIKDRVKLWVKFVKIAKQLRLMNNFNSLMAIVAGIQNNAIQRLTQTKALIPKDVLKTMVKLDRLMSMKSNFRDYRDLLFETQRPAIPFLGLILSDYTFIVDGNEPRIDNLINFARCKLIYNNCIEILQHFQNAPYDFQPENFQIERMISRAKALNAEEAYAKSCELEPPGPYELTLSGPDVLSLIFNDKTESGEKTPCTPKSANVQNSSSRDDVKNAVKSGEKSESSSTKNTANPVSSTEDKLAYGSARDISDNDNEHETTDRPLAKNSKDVAQEKEPAKEHLMEQLSSLETDSEVET
jgi:hypothetical protein